jgi:hypothetical protein
MITLDRLAGLSGDVSIKAPCRVATTANITLNGLQTIDGVTVVAGDRVLVRSQTDPVQNGIYAADTSDWARDVDFNGIGDCVQGTIVVVISGTLYTQSVWQVTTVSPVIGTNSLTFALMGASALAAASAWVVANWFPVASAALGRTALGAIAAGDVIAFTGANTHAAEETFAVSPVVPTKSPGDNTTASATTAFVTAAVAAGTSALARVGGVRQTVAAGPVTTAGLPSFLPGTYTGLTVSTQNVTSSAPLVATAANGWSATTGNAQDNQGYSSADIVWTGLTASRAAATPNYLYGTIAGGVITPATTILAPIYQWGGTPSITAGQITFNIAEMKAYLGNGLAAPQTDLVVFGEAATDGTGVISTVAYAYNGRYESAFTATLPGASTAVTASHNLGVKPRLFKFIIECTTTNVGYAVGDQVTEGIMSQAASTAVFPHMFWSNTKSGGLVTLDGGSGSFIVASRSVPGSLIQLTAASWKYGWIADRGW